AQSPTRWLDIDDATNHVGETLDEVFAAPAVTGVFAPRCATHTGFTNNRFSVQRVMHYDDELGAFTGLEHNFMEAVAYWLSTDQPVRIVDASAEEGSPSSRCSAP